MKLIQRNKTTSVDIQSKGQVNYSKKTYLKISPKKSKKTNIYSLLPKHFYECAILVISPNVSQSKIDYI